MAKLNRVWQRQSANELATRDDILSLGVIGLGETVERIHLRWRIWGRTNESTVLDLFDAYYVGVCLGPAVGPPSSFHAWSDRNTVDWLWWQGAHAIHVNGVGSAGQTILTYPRDTADIDIRAKRGPRQVGDPDTIFFSFARSGGVVLTDQSVNVNASVLTIS
ncbi:MAG: hypothetical protein ACREM3_29730 [Candidatus Rokuibacteriota bacterium]